MADDAVNSLRVLYDPALAGAINMGRDDALLERVGAGDSPPTLRFYRWDPPTISLGYFQPHAQAKELTGPEGELAIVRRPTGGGAILHDQELTYSITLPLDHPLLACGPNCLYDRMHVALIATLQAFSKDVQLCGTSDDSGAAKGPFFCFARRHKYDVLLGNDKLAGSAQRRTKFAVLQHGSIMLEKRFDQQPMGTIHTIAAMDADELARKLTDQLVETHQLAVEIGAWSADELAAAERCAEKHASREWLERS